MKIRLSKSAAKALRRCDKRDLIRRKLAELADDPTSLSANIKRLQGRPESRLRVQDWRVVFRIEGDVLHVDEIAQRGSVYEVTR